MNKNILIVLVVLVLLGGGLLWAGSRNQTSTQVETITTVESSPVVMDNEGTADATPKTSGDTGTEATTFDVEASNFKFSKKDMIVKQGDTVTVNLSVKEGFHDFTLDEFNAKTKQLGAGGTETITFIAGKTGTFEYYCSVGQHRKMGMVGKLVVE
jgi:plastocyanin